ncbi:uncharacterized protein LOC126665898 [Mercurialis annua]|uniref:uncharacterized protein LOC126665898 n=1 Tax=Mercurialis annua TaxID=3986 RepID=UPI00215EC8B5|nr:uncharacterized protein LOC126665898 [Mercurialis annua]
MENELTWWGNRGSGIIREKLDIFLINNDWKLLFPEYAAFSLGFLGSDHRPIMMDHKKKNARKNVWERQSNRFHLEEVWTTSTDFKEVVKEEWDKTQSYSCAQNLKFKLRRCAMAFKRWGKAKFGTLKSDIKRTKEELQRILNSSEVIIPFDKVKKVEDHLEELLQKEEIIWKQRAKVDWLAHGDKNTCYFHRRACKRKARNLIRGVNE